MHASVRVLGISLALSLTACQTGYVRFDCAPRGAPWPMPGWNCMGGYSEIELADLTYTVRFEGIGISRSMAEEYALLRAAELALEHDRSYFVVLSASDSTSTQTTSTPAVYDPPVTTCNKKGRCTTTGGNWTNLSLRRVT